MSNKDANRVISLEFIEDLKEGNLKELTDLVRKDKSLLMCFRCEYINVYYKGHSIFKIKKYTRDKEKNEYGHIISFDFGHARFTEDWKKKLDELESIGYEQKGNEIVSYTPKMEKNDFWNKSVEILKTYMDDYFDVEKKNNYFKDGVLENKKNYLEKQRQQQIMSSNQDFKNGYFIYDMEFSQANENKDVPKSGRFDMLALKINEETMNIVFIELKSTLSACNDKETGIEAHYNGITEYMLKEELIKTRIDEAAEIYGIYCELGLISNEIKNINIEQSKVKILFILTDKATNYEIKDECIEIIELKNGNYSL